MFDDLSQVKRRYEELAYRMTTPEAMNDPAAYAAMMREYKELTPLVEAYRSYTALQKEVDEEKALLDAPTEDAADGCKNHVCSLERADIVLDSTRYGR